MPLLACKFFYEKYSNYNKGIAGEDRVEKYLKEFGVQYQRDVPDSSERFDYDFIVKHNNKYYLLEVKNLSKIDERKISRMFNRLRKNSATLSKEYSTKGEKVWVEPLLICLDKPPYAIEGYISSYNQLRRIFLND